MIQLIRSAIQPVKKESSHQHFAAQIQRKYVRAGVLGWNPISLVFRANTGIMRQEDAAPRPIVINFQWHLARLREQKNTIQVLQEKLYYLLDRADKEKPGQGEQEIPPAFQHYYNWENHPDTRQSLKPHIASIYREKILERLLWETIREISSSKLLDKPVNNHPTPFRERTGRIAGRLPGHPSYRYMGSQSDVRTDGQTEAINYQRLNPAIYFNPPYNGAGEWKAASGRENHIIGYLYQQAALAGEIDAVRDIDVNHLGKKRLLQALIKIEQSNLITSEAEKNEHSGRAEQKIKRLLKQLLLWQAIRINKPQNWMRSSGEHSRTRNYPGQVGRKTIGRWQKLLSSINMQINAPELLPRGRAVSVEPIKRNYPAKIPNFSKAGFPEVQVAQSEAARHDMLAVMVYLKPRSFKQYMMERRWPRAMSRFEEEPASPGGSAYRAKLLDHWFRQNTSEARKRISPDRIDKNNLGQLNDRAIMSRRRIPGESSYRYQGEPSAVWPVGTEAVNYPNWKPGTYLLPALSKVERGKRTPGNENQENQIIKYLDHQASYTGQKKDENSKNLDYLDRNGLLPQLIKIEPSKALRFEIKEKERPGKIPGANIENLMQQLLIWQVIRAQEPQGLTGSSRESSRTAHYPVQKQQNITERWLTLMLASKNRGNHAAISNQARIPIVNQYQENDLASEPGILDRSDTNVEKTGPAIPRRIMLAMLVYLKPGWFRQSVMEKHQPRTAAATPEPPGMSKGDYREKILEHRLDAGEASGFIRLPRVEPYSLRQLSNRMGSIAKPWPNQPRYWHNSNRREISARAEGGTAVNLLYPNIYLTLPSRRPGGGKTGLKSQGEIIRYLDNTAALKPQSRKSEHELRRYTDIVSLQSRFGKMEQLQDESRDYQARLPFGTKYEPKLEQLRQELQLWQLIKAQEAGPGPDSSQASARIYHLPGPYLEPTIERWQTLIKEIRREGQAALLPGREKSRSFPAVKKHWQGREPDSLQPRNQVAVSRGGEGARAGNYLHNLLIHLHPDLSQQFMPMPGKRQSRAVFKKEGEAGPGPDSSWASARIYHLPGPYLEPTIERWQTLIKEIRREGQAALLPGREKSRSFPAVKKYWQGREPDSLQPRNQVAVSRGEGARAGNYLHNLLIHLNPDLSQQFMPMPGKQRLRAVFKKEGEAGPGPDSSRASARIYHLPGPYVEQSIERWQTLIKEIRREGQAALLPGREKSRSSSAVKKYWQGREPDSLQPRNQVAVSRGEGARAGNYLHKLLIHLNPDLSQQFMPMPGKQRLRAADQGSGFLPAHDLAAPKAEPGRAGNYIWSLLLYLKPGLSKQLMLDKRRPRAVAETAESVLVGISQASDAKARLGSEPTYSSNIYRVKMLERLISRSIKDVSGLKLPLPINEERSRLAKNRVKNINMPMPASFRQLNGDAQNEVMVVDQTGASGYLNLNPFSIGRNRGAVSTHRYNKVGDYNRSPVLLTGTRAFKEAGDIFSSRYIYHSLQYRGTRSPEARQAEAREIMRYIENRVPVLNQRNSAEYESPNYLDMRSPWRIFIKDQKQEYRLKYSPAKERMERRLNQLLQELALGQLIKMQEAGSLPGSSREIQGIYRYPAQARQKKPDGVKNLVHERISKKMNTVFLRSKDQAQPSRPLKSKYSVGITGHRAPSSLHLQAGKQARSSSAHQELPDYARPVQLQTKVLQQHLSDRESLESPLKQRAQFINIETTIIHDIREFGIKTLQKQLGQESSKADRQGARRAQSAEGQSNTMLSFHQAWLKPANKYKTDPLPGMLKNKPAIFSPHEYMKMAADLSLNYKHENKQVSAVQPPVPPQQVINTIDSAVQDNSGKAALPVSRQEIKRIADQVFQELEQKIKQERQRRGFPG